MRGCSLIWKEQQTTVGCIRFACSLIYRMSEWVGGHLGPSKFQEPRHSAQVLSTHHLGANVLTTITQIASQSFKPGGHA